VLSRVPHNHVTRVLLKFHTYIKETEGMNQLRALIVMMLVVGGCATAYKPVGFSGGYSETRLGDNIFQVTFRGNGYTNAERAADFSLLRAAELATENWFSHFIVVDTSHNQRLSTYTTPITSQTTGSAYASGSTLYGQATTTTYGGQTYLISKPSSTNTIVCFKEQPEVNVLVYEAEYVRNSIRQKYGISG
jgi:hypothetical protein